MTGALGSKVISIALCTVAVLALVGYLVGTGGTARAMASIDEELWAEPERNIPSEVPLAVPYRELASVDRSPNADFISDLRRLRVEATPLDAAPSVEAKHAALADRARNRAFAGAPPTVPHPVDQRDAASCLACHGEGLRVMERYASKVSHPHYTNCTQCHVAAAPELLPWTPPPANAFVAAEEPTAGPRAFAAAPPQIPHTTWLRQDCLSCHGPAGRAGLRTSHPDRRNCMQCHAPGAELDQRAAGEAAFPLHRILTPAPNAP